MRPSILRVCAVALLAAACGSPAPYESAEVAGDAWPVEATATAEHVPSHVVVLKTSTLTARCSGVVIAPKTLLTADHCIDEGERPPVAYLPAGAKSGQIGRVIRRDPGRDLAWVQMPTELPPVELGNGGVEQPVTLERPLWGGALLGSVLRQNGAYYRLSVAVIHGDSGSPVFSAAGELVALVTTCEADEATPDPLDCKVHGESNAAVVTPEDSEGLP